MTKLIKKKKKITVIITLDKREYLVNIFIIWYRYHLVDVK